MMVRPREVARQAPGTVMQRFRSATAGTKSRSAQASLERSTLSAALVYSLVQTARSCLTDQPCCLAGMHLHLGEQSWHCNAGLNESSEVQQLCLAAIGAQVSSHSAITGSATTPALATAARQTAALRLAARALARATDANLFDPAHPTPNTFAAARLMVYTLRSAAAGGGALGTYQTAMLAHRSRVLDALAADGEQSAGDEHVLGSARIGGAVSGLHANWALADVALAGHMGADEPWLSDGELELHFGLVIGQTEGDLLALEAVANRVDADSGYVPFGELTELADAATRACLWVLRTLLDVRRRHRRHHASLDQVAPSLIFATSTLSRVSAAWTTFTGRVVTLGTAATASWDHQTYDTGRRLLGLDLFTHDILELFLRPPPPDAKCDAPGRLTTTHPSRPSRPRSDSAVAQSTSLTRLIRWRAACALKCMLSRPGVLVPDSFGRPSWLGSCVGSLPPGIGCVELAIHAARDWVFDGELGGVGVTVDDLKVLLAGLRRTVVLGGPSGTQAEALERGIDELESELDSARPDGEGAMARRMVHLALADVNEET